MMIGSRNIQVTIWNELVRSRNHTRRTGTGSDTVNFTDSESWALISLVKDGKQRTGDVRLQ